VEAVVGCVVVTYGDGCQELVVVDAALAVLAAEALGAADALDWAVDTLADGAPDAMAEAEDAGAAPEAEADGGDTDAGGMTAVTAESDAVAVGTVSTALDCFIR
jgi:hypothetical protein